MTSRYTQWAVIRDVSEARRATIVSVHGTRDEAFDAMDSECGEDTEQWQAVEVSIDAEADDRIWV